MLDQGQILLIATIVMALAYAYSNGLNDAANALATVVSTRALTPIAAVVMGATIIEKHFTLDRTLPGTDHAASMDPDELKAMVYAIRNIEKAMGDGVKSPSLSEAKNIPIARKSIVAKRTIKKGEKFSEENLTVKRPGTGISPMEWDEYIGKFADREYQRDDLIR